MSTPVNNNHPKSSSSTTNKKFRRTQGSGVTENINNSNKKKSKKPTNTAEITSWKRNEVHDNVSSNINTSNSNDKNDTKDDDFDTCIICTDELKYAALSPCHHKTCHKCTFRQRALYNKNQCLVCRTENDNLIFTEQVSKDYEDFKGTTDFSNPETFTNNYNIHFTSKEVETATLQLLKYNCPFGDTGEKDFGSFKKYNEHLKGQHDRTICMICAEHKNAFPSELPIFTHNQLRNHQVKGNSSTGFNGHPLCAFCNKLRFYGDDELYRHMRDKHEKCHICNQIDPNNPQYFKNYDQLFEHFQSAHYVCTVRSCLDAKFVVFKTDLDLQAHIAKEHGSLFGVGNNNGNSTNTFKLPITNGGRRFQSELSTFQPSFLNDNDVNRSANRGSNSNANNNNRHNGTIGTLIKTTNNTNSDNGDRTVQKLRMEERARHYLHYSSKELDKFVSINDNYIQNVIDVNALYDAYKKLFAEINESDISLLLYDFSHLFPENSTKNKELLKIYEKVNNTEELSSKFPSLRDALKSGVTNSDDNRKTHKTTSITAINTSNSTPSFKSNGSWNRFGNGGGGGSSSSGSSSAASRMNFPPLPTVVPKKKQQYPQPVKKNVPTVKSVLKTNVNTSATSGNNRINGSSVAISNTTNNNNNSKKNVKFSQEKFPPLPTITKKRAPLVSSIPDPKSWSNNSNTKDSNNDSNATLNLNKDSNNNNNNLSTASASIKGKKNGRKQKQQLLFHIGI
ncbi:E3 ubiquitin-protein ligase HEL2 SCDLUD_004708 [Saccharomycodes ludwigii]|uniref:E3 ubiquitin-protein ligase HEL2 n=1 Tax=Saccharomycodes ludwigii TaxID=36035 RepID=UPI001E850EC6|nr:hypothetical protein SCDLUD_004708 [Saccharomycodes ludwigii]KAH3899272.1 hypothetical protein SCDLUD_004708 [Saccharomycodes ludwigii]